VLGDSLNSPAANKGDGRLDHRPDIFSKLNKASFVEVLPFERLTARYGVPHGYEGLFSRQQAHDGTLVILAIYNNGEYMGNKGDTMQIKELKNLEAEVTSDIRVRRQLGGFDANAEIIVRILDVQRLIIGHLLEQAKRKKK
jgi:hypothetical protein